MNPKSAEIKNIRAENHAVSNILCSFAASDIVKTRH